VDVTLPEGELDVWAALWSESTGRLLLTARPEDLPALRGHLGAHGLVELGQVVAPEADARLVVRHGGRSVVDVSVTAVRERYAGGLAEG